METNLPINGRVVVIDDNFNEALPLIQVLAKKGIPVSYFTGDQDSLPDSPIDPRVIFLDIHLGIGGNDDRTIISVIINVLKQIIQENTYYFIIAWTKHNELIDKIKNELQNNKRNPLFILNLEKTECKKEDGSFNIQKIEEKLKTELKNLGIFHLFILWENIVHKSAGKIVNDFSAFYPVNDDWNNNMTAVFKKLAESYAGQLDTSNATEVVKNALFTFNGTFLDTLESQIENNNANYNITFSNTSINKDIIAEINTRLHLARDVGEKIMPGNIYKLEQQSDNLIVDIFNGKFDSFDRKEDLMNNSQLIYLEVSPSCDYAQRKWKMHRILPGLMWPTKFEDKIKKADYIYKTPIFRLNNNNYLFVFDLRFLTSFELNSIKNLSPICRIRHQLLVDIQSKISGHINRPGIISL